MKQLLKRLLFFPLSLCLSAQLCLPVQAADPEGMPDLSDPEQLLDAYIRTVGGHSARYCCMPLVVIGIPPAQVEAVWP